MITSNIIGLDGQPLVSSQPYEGATGSPRGALWQAGAVGPNQAVASSGAVLRNRSRHAYRNSSMLRSAISKGVISEVGKGAVLASVCDDDTVRDELNKLWRQHQYQLSPWGDLPFGGIMAQACRARKTAGEVFIRRIPVAMTFGLQLPFQLQVLESEFCPMGLNKKLSETRRIVQGIEFNGVRKAAIWLHKRHPTDSVDGTISLTDLVRVPIRDIIHHFSASRPGQVRGEPDTSAALLKDKVFADYSDAELNRKLTRSGFTGFLYRDGFGDEDLEFDPQTGKRLFEDEDGESVEPPPADSETVQAGTILRGMAGEKLELFPGDQGGGYAEFAKWQVQQLAAAMDIPYPLLSGDWDGLSDRTIRAILNEYRRGVAADQTNLMGYQVCLSVWQWVVESAILTGKISAPGFATNPWRYYALDIRHDSWRHLHPEQEQNASKKAVENMVSNPEREAAERGTDLIDNMKATARSVRRWKEICKEEGIDPSEVSAFNTMNTEKEKQVE